MLLGKVDKGGEDAFLVSGFNGGVIAVADGVSRYLTVIPRTDAPSFIFLIGSSAGKAALLLVD